MASKAEERAIVVARVCLSGCPIRNTKTLLIGSGIRRFMSEIEGEHHLGPCRVLRLLSLGTAAKCVIYITVSVGISNRGRLS